MDFGQDGSLTRLNRGLFVCYPVRFGQGEHEIKYVVLMPTVSDLSWSFVMCYTKKIFQSFILGICSPGAGSESGPPLFEDACLKTFLCMRIPTIPSPHFQPIHIKGGILLLVFFDLIDLKLDVVSCKLAS